MLKLQQKRLSKTKMDQYLEIFRRFDKDDSGQIDKGELSLMIKACGIKMNDQEIDDIIKEYDVDKNETINFYEFTQIF